MAGDDDGVQGCTGDHRCGQGRRQGRFRSHSDRQCRRGHRDPQAVRMKLALRLRGAAPAPPISVGGSAANTSGPVTVERSEEHTSELPSLMRTSYAVLCLKKKNKCNTRMTTKHEQINATHIE